MNVQVIIVNLICFNLKNFLIRFFSISQISLIIYIRKFKRLKIRDVPKKRNFNFFCGIPQKKNFFFTQIFFFFFTQIFFNLKFKFKKNYIKNDRNNGARG